MGEVNMSRVRPYGDSMDDGLVQLSFTLPVPFNDKAKEGARQLCLRMGLLEPNVVHAADLGESFSFFIVYARTPCSVDFNTVKVDRAAAANMNKTEIETYCQVNLRRKPVIIGACIGTDAHTVGIDAIMNMKGYNGHKGLEAYHTFAALNLGAQVSSEELVVRARETGADAILVSQVVTQKNIHLANLTRLAELLEAENMRERTVLVVGGPRISHRLAKELGYDAGFGPGTYAADVASFVVQELERRDFNKWGEDKWKQ